MLGAERVRAGEREALCGCTACDVACMQAYSDFFIISRKQNSLKIWPLGASVGCMNDAQSPLFTLYSTPKSAPGCKVLACCRQLALPHRLELVDVYEGQGR